MKRLILFMTTLLLAACASEPESMRLPPPEGVARSSAPLSPSPLQPSPGPVHSFDIAELQSHLGLDRSPQSLGYDVRDFDGCQWGVGSKGGNCGRRYLSVVHFRLLCRDTVGTIQSVATNFTPLAGRPMQWRLAGVQGATSTDHEGFGQARVISQRPTTGERFILIIGKKSLGLEVGEVSQIILPGNWCGGLASTNGLSLPALADFGVPYVLTSK